MKPMMFGQHNRVGIGHLKKCNKQYDTDVAVKAMLQVKDLMMKSEELKASAMVNDQNNFEFTYFDNIDDALIEGLDVLKNE